MHSDEDLYRRGASTLVASWEEYARGAAGAGVRRLPHVAAAVFPNEPERAVYNNALVDRDLTAAQRADAIGEMEAAYRGAGVTGYAVWANESDTWLRADLERRGYVFDSSTSAMGMPLDDIPLPRPEVDLAAPDWSEYLRLLGVAPDFLSRAGPAAYHVVLARLDGETVATGMAFDLDGDSGIYNVGTLERARRRGLGTAVTLLLLHDARRRGCQTASLQSTEIAERVYSSVGFRDLGRIVEYVPG
jgi:ribosomal protein S18 acetylase RimI-like enzyme